MSYLTGSNCDKTKDRPLLVGGAQTLPNILILKEIFKIVLLLQQPVPILFIDNSIMWIML
jgi:hypothetical protein